MDSNSSMEYNGLERLPELCKMDLNYRLDKCGPPTSWILHENIDGLHTSITIHFNHRGAYRTFRDAHYRLKPPSSIKHDKNRIEKLRSCDHMFSDNIERSDENTRIDDGACELINTN